ncbi:MAG: mycofactocin biosynthesis chaperone MftB [Microthrixaceae bacterium]|nr:mycofactocin biosynthesis chaperone MftB [Microthrixaceae bacterium]HMT25308.1 mycofactocin biosynthesis chaperone MftB [Microthrixaceae bacterium]HMT59988.1 mycofactocin biosynthesis chaperone MftB [Microthrixaceae bacterium]
MRGLLIDAIDAAEVTFDLAQRYELDPQVSLRPEPFGALAYHFGNRRLTFLRHPDVVEVVRQLGQHESAAATLRAVGVDERRWHSFRRALARLLASEMIRVRPV